MVFSPNVTRVLYELNKLNQSAIRWRTRWIFFSETNAEISKATVSFAFDPYHNREGKLNSKLSHAESCALAFPVIYRWTFP